MTTKEYLDIAYNEDEESKRKIVEYNKALVKEYPFLLPYHRWTGKPVMDYDEDFEWQYTEMDCMPNGWRLAFGDDFLKELKEELIKYPACEERDTDGVEYLKEQLGELEYLDTFLYDYRIMQIKEKYGGLRWYDNGTPIGKLSEDYEEIIRPCTESFPEYDREKYALIFDYTENYESIFDDNGEAKKDAKEIIDRNKARAIEHYKKYRILEKCKIYDIIDKYEDISYTTCICCGKPAKYITLGWISPFCEDCIGKVTDKYKTVEEYFGE